MAKYTPGPWRIERGRVVDRSGNVVARVPVENRSLAEVREGSGNTHLIAAAPELLEAAKLLVSLFDRGDFNDDRWEDLWDAFQAAISKAESSNQLEK